MILKFPGRPDELIGIEVGINIIIIIIIVLIVIILIHCMQIGNGAVLVFVFSA